MKLHAGDYGCGKLNFNVGTLLFTSYSFHKTAFTYAKQKQPVAVKKGAAK